MYKPPDHDNEGGQGGPPGYRPPPRYSHEPLGGAGEGARPVPVQQDEYPPQVVREGDIEVYPSYDAYLATQGQGGERTRDLKGVVDEGADRTLSAVAHGAIAFGVLGIGILVSLVISGFLWIYGKRSPKVRFHAEQAGCFQVIVLTVNALAIVGLGAAGGFAIFQNFLRREDYGTSWLLCIGLVLFAVWFVVTILYGLYGAANVLAGREFKYPVIGKWLKKRVE